MPLLAAIGLVAGLTTAGVVMASDHQDTPEVELNPRFDVNDVYAFPAPREGRIVLVLGTSSPLTPAGTPSAVFGTKEQELYQIKVDNDGDAREDLVFQATFTGTAGNQRVTLRGPYQPNVVGATGNTLLTSGPTISGPVNQILGSTGGVQLFAGPRDDPFFIDLEQFFRIIPDRRPSTGPLSPLPTPASSFREKGKAVDFVTGYNDLAIVVELPAAMLYADGKTPGKLGVWGTTSRARAN
ncbi:MAG TPA: DUF4331 family protein [Gemmatimonadaceae bacterium]|nr:DUF4331 family protein [Gemmatimonadaceae bacterium]